MEHDHATRKPIPYTVNNSEASHGAKTNSASTAGSVFAGGHGGSPGGEGQRDPEALGGSPGGGGGGARPRITLHPRKTDKQVGAAGKRLRLKSIALQRRKSASKRPVQLRQKEREVAFAGPKGAWAGSHKVQKCTDTVPKCQRKQSGSVRVRRFYAGAVYNLQIGVPSLG